MLNKQSSNKPMKKLIILTLLFSVMSYSQSATLYFYYGSNQMTGAEILFYLKGTENTYLGGGFSGAWNKNKAMGEWRQGHITENDLKLENSTTKEQWCSLYFKISTGYLGKFLIAYKGGLAVYDKKMNFKTENPTNLEPEYYNKNYKVLCEPMIGLDVMYQITKDYGINVGYDTFNGGTIGVSVIFE